MPSIPDFSLPEFDAFLATKVQSAGARRSYLAAVRAALRTLPEPFSRQDLADYFTRCSKTGRQRLHAAWAWLVAYGAEKKIDLPALEDGRDLPPALVRPLIGPLVDVLVETGMPISTLTRLTLNSIRPEHGGLLDKKRGVIIATGPGERYSLGAGGAFERFKALLLWGHPRLQGGVDATYFERPLVPNEPGGYEAMPDWRIRRLLKRVMGGVRLLKQQQHKSEELLQKLGVTTGVRSVQIYSMQWLKRERRPHRITNLAAPTAEEARRAAEPAPSI